MIDKKKVVYLVDYQGEGSTMSKLEFSIEKLIEVVKAHKNLYDITRVEYRDKKVKEREWIEVCREVCTTNCEITSWDDLSVTEKTDFLIEVKKKWTSLRDCFKREIRIIEKNEYKKKKYLFYDALLFLEPFSRCRPMPPEVVKIEYQNCADDDIVVNENEVNVKQEPNEDYDSDDRPLNEVVACKTETINKVKILTPEELSLRAESSQLHNDSNVQNTQMDNIEIVYEKHRREGEDEINRKRRRVTENVGECSEKNDRKSDSAESADEDHDDDQAFLKSLLPTFKEMTTEQKFHLRIEIMQTILKFKQENKNSQLQ